MEKLIRVLGIAAILAISLFPPTGEHNRNISQAATIPGGGSPGEVSELAWKLGHDLVETQAKLKTLKTQNMDLLDENIVLRLENERLKAENQLLQQKSEEYLQQARFHLCRYRQQRDCGTYNSSCMEAMERHPPSLDNKDKSRTKPLLIPPGALLLRGRM
ncbi:hypothetical protein KJ785_03190 [Patescibacteria group bacterium]|nr:hypothetical protein [Patescibacteria group bacterium]